jgi:predicted RNA-binding protein YlqC (UPF0109 family)
MEKLLEFLVKNITGIEDYEIETDMQGDIYEFVIKVPDDEAGLIIGKKGKTIRIIRNLLKVKATLERKRVNIVVNST